MSLNTKYNFYGNESLVTCVIKCNHISTNVPCDCNCISKITLTFSDYSTNIDIEKNPIPTAPNTPTYEYTSELRQSKEGLLQELRKVCSEEYESLSGSERSSSESDESLSDTEPYSNPTTPQWYSDKENSTINTDTYWDSPYNDGYNCYYGCNNNNYD